jgi:NDP-sugar pyrophosphorylase family protein
MAGGKGTRLDPFTRVLPKPLIPIGDKAVIEIIIDSFLGYGVTAFHISINHKAKLIKSFFEELHPTYSVKFIEEDQPLGTIGGLRALIGLVDGPLIVTNCDIIVRADYADLVHTHEKDGNDITVVASLKDYNIPYGVCELEAGGRLKRIIEKPHYDLLVNTGMYVLRSDILSLIPENRMCHATELIDIVVRNGGKIGVFPISEKAWLDTGEWAEYRRAVQALSQDS